MKMINLQSPGNSPATQQTLGKAFPSPEAAVPILIAEYTEIAESRG